MITLLTWFTLAFASPDLTRTAETLDAGEVVVRMPTGPSAVGIVDGTELWTTPYDVGIGGPRLGVEQRLVDHTRFQWSASPSIALKTSAKRMSTRLDTTVSGTFGEHRLSASLGADLRYRHRLTLDDKRERTLSFDRVQLPLHLVYDWTRSRSTVRTRAMLPLSDRGQTLSYGTGSVSYLHDFGKLRTETGVGMLIGQPKDQHTLGTFEWFFWMPYPKVDVWFAF